MKMHAMRHPQGPIRSGTRSADRRPWSGLSLLLAALGVVLGGVGARGFAEEPLPRPRVVVPATPQSAFYVAVVGNVARPGVYRFPADNIPVTAVVAAAGGLTTDASGQLRVVRQGRLGQCLFFREGQTEQVRAGDVVLADRTRRRTSSKTALTDAGVAVVGVADRPVVVQISAERTTVGGVLDQLQASLPDGLSLRVLHGGAAPTTTTVGEARGAAIDGGCVIVLGTGHSPIAHVRAIPAAYLEEAGADAPIPTTRERVADRTSLDRASDSAATDTPRLMPATESRAGEISLLSPEPKTSLPRVHGRSDTVLTAEQASPELAKPTTDVPAFTLAPGASLGAAPATRTVAATRKPATTRKPGSPKRSARSNRAQESYPGLMTVGVLLFAATGTWLFRRWEQSRGVQHGRREDSEPHAPMATVSAAVARTAAAAGATSIAEDRKPSAPLGAAEQSPIGSGRLQDLLANRLAIVERPVVLPRCTTLYGRPVKAQERTEGAHAAVGAPHFATERGPAATKEHEARPEDFAKGERVRAGRVFRLDAENPDGEGRTGARGTVAGEKGLLDRVLQSVRTSK